ncbi:MAG: hypothetical protein AAF519_00900 [Bacteroidota bacterium]
MQLQHPRSVSFRLLISILYSLSATIFVSCGDDDDGTTMDLDPVEEFVRLTVVDPSEESLSIQNLGTTEVDITNFQLCLGPGQYNVLSNYTAITGDLNLAVNETVVIDLTSGSEGVTALPDDSGGLGLFSIGGEFNSSDPEIIRDYVQWGSADQNRVDQAVAAERWDNATSFINGFAPYTFSGGSDDVGVSFWNTVDAEDVRLKSGFIINVATPNGDRLVKYFSTLPTGTADLTDGEVFQESFFDPEDIFNGELYTSRVDGSGAFAKMGVNGNGELVEDGVLTLPSNDNSFLIKVVDETTGLLHDRGKPAEISVFNPATMQIDGTIDMSAGMVPSTHRYQTFVISGDEVYAAVRPAQGGTFNTFIFHIANFRTGQFVGQTEFPTGPTTFLTPFGQNWMDDAGNIWVPNGGAIFETNFVSSIHRVPSGSSQFDDYSFVPALAANPLNQLFPQTGQVYFLSNNRAVALVITEVPDGVIDLLQSVGGNPANLSQEQIDQAINLFFIEETGRWVELDLEAQTAAVITGLPLQGGFAQTFVAEINGLIYLSITSTTEDAFYTYDINTKQAQKAFDVEGGSIIGLYDLSQNN